MAQNPTEINKGIVKNDGTIARPKPRRRTPNSAALYLASAPYTGNIWASSGVVGTPAHSGL